MTFMIMERSEVRQLKNGVSIWTIKPLTLKTLVLKNCYIDKAKT